MNKNNIIKKTLVASLTSAGIALTQKAIREIWELQKKNLVLTFRVDACNYNYFGFGLEFIHSFNNLSIRKNLSTNCWSRNIVDKDTHEIIATKYYRVPRTGKYLITLNALNYIYIDIQDKKVHGTSDELLAMGQLTMDFTFIGSEAKKYYNKLANNIEFKPRHTITKTNQISSRFIVQNRVSYYSRNRRDPKSIFLNGDNKDIILKFLDDFNMSGDKYNKFNLPHKCGILFYGDAGCGKTSLSYMIADYLKYEHITIDASTDIETFRNLISSRSVVYIHDIDCEGIDRNDVPTNVNIDDRLNKLKKLLELFDGNYISNDIVFVADTNDITKLDPALIRDCRFDLPMEITPLDNITARSMCEYYNVDPDIILKDQLMPIKPSTLQNLIMNYN